MRLLSGRPTLSGFGHRGLAAHTGGTPVPLLTYFLALCLCASVVAFPSAAQEDRITYEDHIKPILLESCAGCHNQQRAKNGLKLDSYTGIFEGGSSGPAIVKGDPNGSLLYQLVAHTGEPFMPFGEDKLPDATVETIRKWIESGAPQTKDDNSFVPTAPAAPMTLDPAALARPEGAPAMPENLRREPCWWTERPNTIRALACSPFAPLIAVGGHHQVILYHAESFQRLGVLDFPEGDVMTVQFSRDGSILIAGGGLGATSGRVVGWSIVTGQRVFEVGDEPDVVLAADISADNQSVALGGPDRIVRIFDLTTGAQVFEITKHTDWVTALSFSPDGVLLATGDRAGGAFVWEALTGREFYTLPTHNGPVTAIAWRADSQMLATAGEDGFVRLLDAENGREQRAWQSHGGVLALDWSRDGRIATSGRDALARVWNGDGAEQKAFEALPDLATAVAFSHDGSRLIVGGWGGPLRVHNADNGARLADLRANPLTSWEEAVAAAQTEVDRLSAALPDLAAVADAAAQQSASLQTKAQDLEKQVADAKAALDAYINTAQQAEATIAQLDQSLAAFEQQTQARAGALAAVQSNLAILQQRAAETHAQMRVAIEGRLAAERAVNEAEASGDAARIEAAKAALPTAVQLAEGAIAIAQRSAIEVAQAQIAATAAQIDQELWLAHAQPARDQATLRRNESLAMREENARLQQAFDALTATSQQARGEANAAMTAAAAAIDAKSQAETALAPAREKLAAAAAAWEAKKQAIFANNGRVE